MDLHKFAHGKYVAKMCKLRSNLEIRGKDGCQFCLLMTTTASKPQEKRSGIRYGGAISFRGKNVTTVSDLVNHLFLSGLSRHYCPCDSTSSYENRVSKHFVIFLNFHCVIACSLCCLLMSFFLPVLWLGICVEVGIGRITTLSPPTHNSLFNTRDSYLKSLRA